MPEPTNSGGSLNGHTPPPPTSIPVNEFLESFRAKKSGDGPKPPPDEPDAEPSPVDPTPPRDPIPPGRASAKPEPPPPEPEEGPAATPPPPPPVAPIKPAIAPEPLRYLGTQSAEPFPAPVIVRIPLNKALIRAAVFVQDGEAQIVLRHTSEYDEVNNAKALELHLLFEEKRLKHLEHERAATTKTRRRNRHWIERVTADPVARPLYARVMPWAQLILAAVALVSSNIVGGQYIYRSGDDFLGSSPLMASLFYAGAILSAGLLESIHLLIKTERGKAHFRLPFQVLGPLAALCWGIALAVKYGAETGAHSYLHRPEQNFFQAHIAAILMTSNFLLDLAAGFLALAAAIKLIAEGYRLETYEAPIHADLRAHEAAIDAEIKTLENQIALGSQWFSQIKAGRKALEAEVRIAFRLACAQRLGGHAKADGQFLLKPKGPIA